MKPIIIPDKVQARWTEELGRDNYSGLQALAELCERAAAITPSDYINGYIASDFVSDMHTLAAVAHRRALDMQPEEYSDAA